MLIFSRYNVHANIPLEADVVGHYIKWWGSFCCDDEDKYKYFRILPKGCKYYYTILLKPVTTDQLEGFREAGL